MKEPAFDTLIAHRGESYDAPENTLPAYQTAVERGFGFECDIIKKATNVNPDNVLFISFGDKVCAELKRVLPEYKVYFLTAAKFYTADKLVEKLATMGVDGVDISFDPAIIDQKYVERVKAAGYSFHVWTVDNPETAMLAFSVGADTLTTNRAKFILESCK